MLKYCYKKYLSVKDFRMRRRSTSTYIDNSAIPSWGYLGFAALFAIPLVGAIPAIIIAFCARNVNLKNFARAFCIAYIISLVLAGVAFAICSAMGFDLSSLLK